MSRDLEAAREALERVRDYFDQRADADLVGEAYSGNREMHMLRDCDAILAALSAAEARVAAARKEGAAEAFAQAAAIVEHETLPRGTEACDVRDDLAAAIRALAAEARKP